MMKIVICRELLIRNVFIWIPYMCVIKSIRQQTRRRTEKSSVVIHGAFSSSGLKNFTYKQSRVTILTNCLQVSIR